MALERFTGAEEDWYLQQSAQQEMSGIKLSYKYYCSTDYQGLSNQLCIDQDCGASYYPGFDGKVSPFVLIVSPVDTHLKPTCSFNIGVYV